MKTAQYARLCFACLLGIVPAAASAESPAAASMPVAASTIAASAVPAVAAPVAAVAPAPPSPFVISADGAEVTDLRTELIWRRCVEGLNWNGTTCAGEPGKFTHEEALQRATAQAKSSGIPWRLPNIKEVSSLFQKGRRNPTIDVTAFPGTPFYFQTWSSTPDVSDPHSAWIFAFSYANLYTAGRHELEYVRLVRDAQ